MKKRDASSASSSHKWIIFVAIFWILILVAFFVPKEFTRQSGREILLKTAPIDPRDLFRGDYVDLNYEISTIDSHIAQSEFKSGDTIYVQLSDEGGYGQPIAASKTPTGDFFIKGTVMSVSGSISVEYGIESYFVPEGTGLALERKRLEANVLIDRFGNAQIKEVRVIN